ncbi:response regulator [Deinococcus oregonensis]|uniref:Response regulator n=1 Tax=Deinococcus oregonensis TaxID=1805970 RepID=A0ABV6B5G0_9DEIO
MKPFPALRLGGMSSPLPHQGYTSIAKNPFIQTLKVWEDSNWPPHQLDINMPDMGGFDVLKVLKADEQLKLIPVVMLTTSNTEQDVNQAYSLYASS